MKTFEANKTYTMSWIGDSELKTPITIISRTEKSVKIIDPSTNKQVTRRVKVWGGEETIQPTGNYSMAPILRASKIQ